MGGNVGIVVKSLTQVGDRLPSPPGCAFPGCATVAHAICLATTARIWMVMSMTTKEGRQRSVLGSGSDACLSGGDGMATDASKAWGKP